MDPQDVHARSYWSQPNEQLLATLQSSAAGLNTLEAQRRLEQYGPNVLETREETP